MAKRGIDPLTPKLDRSMRALGARLRAARLARNITAELVAERARVSRSTIHRLEAGDPSVAVATLLRVMSIYGCLSDIDAVAARSERFIDAAHARQRARPQEDAFDDG